MPNVRLEGMVGSIVQILNCTQEKNKVALKRKIKLPSTPKLDNKEVLSSSLETSEMLELDCCGQGH